MKFEITHLKAPWPDGAKVGDVFDAGDGPVPAWALGKVRQVHDEAKATLKLPRRKALEGEAGDGPVPGNTPVSREQAEAETVEQQAQREREEEAARKDAAGRAPPPDATEAADAKTKRKS